MSFIRHSLSFGLLASVIANSMPQLTLAQAHQDVSGCAGVEKSGTPYTVCRFDPFNTDIRVFLNDKDGQPFGHFISLASSLQSEGEQLTFAMNGGMYHKDRSPVGMYVEKGVQTKSANTNDGPGNFHLKPNGVFYILPSGKVGVSETAAFLERIVEPAYATQSGPMLVINGALHARFLKDSTSRKIRNGVGIDADGLVVFVKSEKPVTFFDFATFFKTDLHTGNALYLDGTISRLYARDLGRNDSGLRMGPIIGVVSRAE